MIDWQRRRHPDDVPTPVAVALADFCRRAKAPASPSLVRQALSTLDEADDFRVQTLAEDEPQARPLGPWAVIDLIRGETAEVASQREKLGYYQVVEALVEEREKKAPPPLPAPVLPPRSAPRQAAPAPSAPRAKKQTKAERVAERVAPQRREAGPPPGPAPFGTSALPKRALPPPRGRFANVDPSRSAIDGLARPEAEETLQALVDQSPTRFALFRTLASGYTGRAGKPLSDDDVGALLERTGHLDAMRKKERSGVLLAVADAKGSLGRAAGSMGMTLGQLEFLVKDLKVAKELKEVRERFAREALATGNVALRLDLLGRDKYLADLGVEKQVHQALTKDLTALAKTTDGPAAHIVSRMAQQHGLSLPLLRKAVEKLGLKLE
jgi:hypothetical protein